MSKKVSTLKLISKIANELGMTKDVIYRDGIDYKNGMHTLCFRTSRQSDSIYIYADNEPETFVNDNAELKDISIRVSDHANPAKRLMRVSDCCDHATECDVELDTREWGVSELATQILDALSRVGINAGESASATKKPIDTFAKAK